jgi:hypothetical protein
MHVRGALMYNYLLEKHNLTMKYETIQEGEKIKFLYLKEPNTIRENCIGFIGKIPPELNIHRYVDYDTMFNKSFLEPLKQIVEGIGWKTEVTASLEDLFG